MGVSEIGRLKQLEDENAKLKKLVADLTLDRAMLQDGLRERSGEARRSAPGSQALSRWPTARAERRACQTTGFHRPSQRYRRRSDPQVELRMRLKELAAVRVRYKYRRLHILLRQEGWPVNPKRNLPPLPRGGPLDPSQGAPPQAGLALPPGATGDQRTQRGLGDGLHERPAL